MCISVSILYPLVVYRLRCVRLQINKRIKGIEVEEKSHVCIIPLTYRI